MLSRQPLAETWDRIMRTDGVMLFGGNVPRFGDVTNASDFTPLSAKPLIFPQGGYRHAPTVA